MLAGFNTAACLHLDFPPWQSIIDVPLAAATMLTPNPALPRREILDTHRKALAINLDERRYGTFAEIGAGQEVARWFFRVGGAAGTIAKSMSAYDMAVSDAIYGHTERYVSRDRLQAMLDYEHDLNVKRLSAARGDTTAFFAFADTVTAKGFRSKSECHGWMGLKFQSHPRDAESQIVLHVRMLDLETSLQQEALGIVGVNLCYGAFFHHHEPEVLVESLLDNLSTARLEIDMIQFSGIEFRHVDNRLMSLKLVELGLSQAAMFGAKGEVLQATEALHRKPALVQRGFFRPVTNANIDMLRCARRPFAAAQDRPEEDVFELMEITMRNLLTEDGAIDMRDFLARADVLGAAGMPVLISNYFEHYKLANFLRRCTSAPIAMVLPAASLAQVFDEKYYGDLDGGVLEAIGRLFGRDLKIYVYPTLGSTGDLVTTAASLGLQGGLDKLYGYLLERDKLVHVEGYDPVVLSITPREVLRFIKAGDARWQSMVPEAVADLIKRRGFFGARA